MKKSIIPFLLTIPFVISIFAFVTATVIIKNNEQDISSINWNYKDNEAFSLKVGKIKLESSYSYNEKYPLGSNNSLVWFSSNPKIAKVSKIGDSYYLELLSEGKTKVTCSNEKGNVSKSFLATVYGNDGAIIFNPIKEFSQSGITDNKYVGFYDFKDDKKVKSNFPFSLEIYGNDKITKDNIEFNLSDNLSIDLANNVLNYTGFGKANIRYSYPYSTSESTKGEYEFNIIDGVNIYNYNDLLLATNLSSEGEVAILRNNLESLNNLYDIKDDKYVKKSLKNTELFGNFDFETKKFNFQNEICIHDSTFNIEYLDLYNKTYPDYPVKTNIYSGIKISKDFYGNGFVINTHDLVYPSGEKEVSVNGEKNIVPVLTNDDLFRGPNMFMAIGAPKTIETDLNPNVNLPVFGLYGQDNSAFYIKGNNILLEGVNFKGCDFGNNMENLKYTGTVMEVEGDNITLKNSLVSNGRNGIRSYSSMNFNIDNCLLSNAYEFLLRTGTNEYNRVDLNKKITYKQGNETKESTVNDYIARVKDFDELTSYKAESILTYATFSNTPGYQFIGLNPTPFSKQDYLNNQKALQSALFNDSGFYNSDGSKNYKGSVNINNTFFYNSGIASISADTYYQGSYLENNMDIAMVILAIYSENLYPSKLALSSYPSKITITGDTRFYNWKDFDSLDYSSLIFQDIEAFIDLHGGVGSVNVTTDDYLPLKEIIKKDNEKILKTDGDKKYINNPVFKMGGGLNTTDIFYDNSYFNEEFSLNPYAYTLDKSSPYTDINNTQAKIDSMLIGMGRAAFGLLGFNDWSYLTLNPSLAKWYNQSPNINDLKDRN